MSCVFLNAALPCKEDCLQKLHNTLTLQSACEYDYVSKFVVSVVLVQYAAPLVCMEARKRARLSQKELERIAG